jgi:hypothetical protein
VAGGFQTITDYEGKPSRELPSDEGLSDELNAFYVRLEASDNEACMRAPAVPDDCVITLSVAGVSNTFKQGNIPMAAGPDGLPRPVPVSLAQHRARRITRTCPQEVSSEQYADKLASVFTDMFNLSLTESVIPTCFKQTTILRHRGP